MKKRHVRISEAVRRRHAARIYAQMLCQVCNKGLYEPNINGFQEVYSRCDVLLLTVIHDSCNTCKTRHILCQISERLSTGYRYGEEYKTSVSCPYEVTIENRNRSPNIKRNSTSCCRQCLSTLSDVATLDVLLPTNGM